MPTGLSRAKHRAGLGKREEPPVPQHPPQLALPGLLIHLARVVWAASTEVQIEMPTVEQPSKQGQGLTTHPCLQPRLVVPRMGSCPAALAECSAGTHCTAQLDARTQFSSPNPQAAAAVRAKISLRRPRATKPISTSPLAPPGQEYSPPSSAFITAVPRGVPGNSHVRVMPAQGFALGCRS